MDKTIGKFTPNGETPVVDVPASKSLLNRAMLLAALSPRKVKIICGDLSGDTRAMLACLTALGIECTATTDGVFIRGCGGRIPNRSASINVQSAGTAARFLTIALAFCGGSYDLDASEQMKRRPMDVIGLLKAEGVAFSFREKDGNFPFRMQSEGIAADVLSLDTDVSTQYASGVLLAAPVLPKPLKIVLTGSRTNGSYIAMTLGLLRAFGVRFERNRNEITVYPGIDPPNEYRVEADVSGACYFYALSLLCSCRVLVNGVYADSAQSDMKFLAVLKDKGVAFTQTQSGLLADASAVSSFDGFDLDVNDFSDQTLTLAALAPFATSKSILRNVEHIKKQECDRILAITKNLTALGVPVRSDGKTVEITPAPVHGGRIETFDDHRVAMSFALIGLKNGNVTIDNPECCKKTFENYFAILDTLTR